MKFSLLVLTLGLFVSCESPGDRTIETKTSAIDSLTDMRADTRTRAFLFRQFVRKFKKVDLPFVFREAYTGSHKPEDMTKFNSNSFDTLFLNPDDADETFCLGVTSDTTKFFSLIYFFPADNYYPVLATYSKNGDLISKEALIANGCGGDCGLRSCSETGILDKDYSIYCADTLIYDFICDENSDSIPNSRTLLINSKTGSVSMTGKIKTDKVKRTESKQNSL